MKTASSSQRRCPQCGVSGGVEVKPEWVVDGSEVRREADTHEVYAAHVSLALDEFHRGAMRMLR